MKFITSSGPWGYTPGRRKLLPHEKVEWQIVPLNERIGNEENKDIDPLDAVRQEIEVARSLPLGWPSVEVEALPSLHNASSPEIMELVDKARAFGTDEFHLVDPEGHKMTFRLFL